MVLDLSDLRYFISKSALNLIPLDNSNMTAEYS